MDAAKGREQLKLLAGFCEKVAVAVLTIGGLRALFERDGTAYFVTPEFGWVVLLTILLVGCALALVSWACEV